MIDIHKQAFIEEASDLLTQLESGLLELENVPDDVELIAKVFRILHTIKGSSGMFGYDDITMFTHDIENVYDRIRNGDIKITKEIIDLTLAARDQIALLLTGNNDKRIIDDDVTKGILTSFRDIILDFNAGDKSKTENEPEMENKKVEKPFGNLLTYLIKFKPSIELFQNGTNPIFLIRELTEMGESIVLSRIDMIPSLEEIDPELCYTYWDIILKTKEDADAIKDVFIFIEDQCELFIKTIDEENKLKDHEAFHSFEAILLEETLMGNYDVEYLLNAFNLILEEKSITKSVTPKKAKVKERVESTGEAEVGSSLRVSTEKLDELVNLVGELVTTQARLSQLANQRDDAEMITVSEEVERITWSLRDSALNIRMLPIGSTFNKFKRLVRDLSGELGKEVELTTEGADTELDKTVLEKLGDPLVHIIRNCIDHAIELPKEREKAGKPRTGSVQLSASQSGGNVIIEISDDGAGLDKEVIRAKAVKNGLITENAELSETEIFALIFAPGFSTAQKITNVSGRGVGMDVVKRAIESLRGTVDVKSKKGEGTTIVLKLPLTLAIIDGLLVKIADDHYILPLSSVEECVELTTNDIKNAHGRHIINIRGGITPYISLRERFELTSERPDIEQVVIADVGGNRVGFVVDEVFGQHQTVLKSLGVFYKNVKGVSGATIMGDGTVALILDIQQIVMNEDALQNISN
ncbi:MAG: chemotaxis protein CheA [Bacteroidetes bacterium]|nr:chemotaxis protein CheA [Bacteroidota bacterium]